MTLSSPRLPGACMLSLCLAACGSAGAGGGGGVLVRDSAGVTLVENTAPAWREGQGWRVAPAPALRIGVVDGLPEYQLYRVSGAHRLSDGRIVVANSGTNELRFYDREGRHVGSAGRGGEGPGEFRSLGPLFATAADSILVFDFQTRRVSVFDAHGGFGRSFLLQLSAERALPRLAGVFADGRLLAALSRVFMAGEERGGVHREPVSFHVLDRDGAVEAALGEFPGNESFVQVAGAGEARSMAVMSLPFGRPSITRAAGDAFYFGSADDFEIAVHAPDGRPVRLIRREHQNLPVTPGDIDALRRQRLENVTSDALRRHLELMLREAPFPPAMPAYASFQVDAENNLWVEEYRRPADEESRWSVFDAEGRWLGVVTLPPGFMVFAIGSDYVLGRRTDDLDVERVELYELIKS